MTAENGENFYAREQNKISKLWVIKKLLSQRNEIILISYKQHRHSATTVKTHACLWDAVAPVAPLCSQWGYV